MTTQDAGVMRAPADDALAARLRGFGPLGLFAFLLIFLNGNWVLPNLVVLPVGALLVLAWAWRSRTPWREIGYVRPASWVRTIALGLALGVGLKLAMKAVIMPLLGADPVNHAYHFLAGNRAILPTAIAGMFVVGFSEETLFRGYLFERLGKLFGSSAVATTFIVLSTSAWFGLAHYAQGIAGIQQGAIVGCVFGAIFALTRNIWMLIVAHAAFDLTALAIIYWDAEREVAQWLFS